MRFFRWLLMGLCVCQLAACSSNQVWLQVTGKWLGNRLKNSMESGGGNAPTSGGRFPEADNITQSGALPGEGHDLREKEEGMERLRRAISSVEPAADAELCHIHVRFRWTTLAVADGYKLDLWERGASRKPTRVLSIFLNENQYIAQKGLRFGGKYCWRVAAYRGKQLISVTDTVSFSVMNSWRVDATVFRHDAVEYPPGVPTHEMYFFHEASGTLLDLTGKPIWAHPNSTIGQLWNLQRLPNGNFAYMRVRSALDSSLVFEEIRPNGDLVWQSPDSLDMDGRWQPARYGRDFALLLNGHYLFMIQEKDNVKIIEITRKGKIRWQWNSREYVADTDPFNVLLRRNRHTISGFAVAGNFLYISLPIIHNIVVLNRLTNRLTRVIGEKIPLSIPQSGSGLVAVPRAPTLRHRQLCFFDSGSGRDADTIALGISLYVPRREARAVSERYHQRFEGLPAFRQRNTLGGAFSPISATLYAAHEATTSSSLLLDTQHGVRWACNHLQAVGGQWQTAEPNFRIHWVKQLFE